ncbi:hypothetical protein GBA52_000112 [Prunus armeniaca]|nr:hypothetical protein GBA52_000112 [Prunus armeniaca]
MWKCLAMHWKWRVVLSRKRPNTGELITGTPGGIKLVVVQYHASSQDGSRRAALSLRALCKGRFQDLKDVQKIQVYEEIIVASGGRASVRINRLLKGFRAAGIAVNLFVAGLTVWEIFTAENPLEKATHEAVVDCSISRWFVAGRSSWRCPGNLCLPKSCLRCDGRNNIWHCRRFSPRGIRRLVG